MKAGIALFVSMDPIFPKKFRVFDTCELFGKVGKVAF
jgi:hypothetical protein